LFFANTLIAFILFLDVYYVDYMTLEGVLCMLQQCNMLMSSWVERPGCCIFERVPM